MAFFSFRKYIFQSVSILALLLIIQTIQAQQLTYISNGESVYLADLETCSTKEIYNNVPVFHDIAFCPNSGLLYGVAKGELYELDTANSLASHIMDVPDFNSLTCDINGKLYGGWANFLYRVDVEEKHYEIFLWLEFMESAGDLTFYKDSLYLSIHGGGILKIAFNEDLSYKYIRHEYMVDSVFGMITELAKSCTEELYLMANNDIYKLGDDFTPIMHCEDIIEDNILGAASNTEVFSEFSQNLINDLTICEDGDPVLISNSQSQVNYEWSTGLSGSDLLIQQAGLYWVDATLGKCTKRDTFMVSELPKPIIDLGDDPILCSGDSIKLNAYVDGASYLWQDSSINSSFMVKEEGYYLVEVEMNGCKNIDSIYVDYEYCAPEILMPNVFTPNSDKINDYLQPKHIENILKLNTKIYNRFGTMIFETNDLEINWSPINQSSGIYYYILKYEDLVGDRFYKKGWVQVLR
jgi:gliding motility-associated-like protein